MLRRATGFAFARACAGTLRHCTTKGTGSDDTLSSLLDELDQYELGSQGAKTVSPTSSTAGRTPAEKAKKQNPTPRVSRREKTEILRQHQLKKLIEEADQEIGFLVTEEHRAAAQSSVGSLTPSKSSDAFLTGSEQVLEKSPQHFVPSETSAQQVDALPPLRHSGSVAVVTIVGKVVRTPDGGATFFLEYDLPLECHGGKGLIAVETQSPTLTAFVHENVQVGDVVHVLGQLVPSSEPDVVATVFVPHNGGSVSTVLRPKT